MRGIHGIARTVPVLAVVLLLGVGGYLVYTGVRDDGGVEIAEAPELTDWPTEVQPLVRFVERERGLGFRRLVTIDFLPEAEFVEEVTGDEGDLTDEDRAEIETATATLRAVGLVDDGVDLLEQSRRLQGAGVVGLYSFEDEHIRVRGDDLTVSVRSTLVHELTHALQDQHFDIGDRVAKLGEADDVDGTDTTGPFRAIIEGDAERIETAYVDGLSKRARARLDKEQARDAREFERESKDIPPVLVTLLGAPYALGESLLDLAIAVGNDDAADDLLEEPPTTDEALLDPWTLLADDGSGNGNGNGNGSKIAELEVDVPRVGDTEEQSDSGSFGALGWYVVLAQRVSPRTALRATDGWGGDAFSSFERDGRSCLRIAYRGDRRRDVDELADALDEWIAETPDSALVQRTRTGLLFTSCETTTPARSRPQDAVLQAPVVRTVIATGALGSGASESAARCYARKIVDELTPAEINSDSPAVVTKARAIGRSCAG